MESIPQFKLSISYFNTITSPEKLYLSSNVLCRSQMKYNDAHTHTRAVIERSFGWLKRRFMVLHGEIRVFRYAHAMYFICLTTLQ